MSKVTRNRRAALIFLRVLLACAVLEIGLAQSAYADTIYTYTGNGFSVYSGGYSCPSPPCKITGSFTLVERLAGNLISYSLTPKSFSFTDGNATLTPLNSTVSSFQFSTDANGNLTAWVIHLEYASHYLLSLCYNASCGGLTEVATNYVTGASAINPNTPGLWTPTITNTEPGSLLLLGTGLLGIVGVLRRKWLPTSS